MGIFDNPMVRQILLYFALVLLGFIMANVYTNGFLWQYLLAKSSKGKKLLLRVKSKLDYYYLAVPVIEGFFRYKARGQKEFSKLILIPNDTIYMVLGVKGCDVDEETNAVLKADYSVVSPFNAEKYDNLYVRALTKPVIMDAIKLILIGLIVIGIVGLISAYFGFMTYRADTQILKILSGGK